MVYKSDCRKSSLDAIGMAFARIKDDTLARMSVLMERYRHPSVESDFSGQKYFDSLPSDIKNSKLMQMAIESYIHSLLVFFNESEKFFLIAKLDDGELFDIKNITEEFLWEAHRWAEEFSKNGSVLSDIMDINTNK